MENTKRKTVLKLLAAVTLLLTSGASPADQPYEYFQDVELAATEHDAPSMRALFDVVVVEPGIGRLEVMISSEGLLDWHQIGAGIEFFDASGRMTRQALFEDWFSEVEYAGTHERKISRFMPVGDFDDIQVRLYRTSN